MILKTCLFTNSKCYKAAQAIKGKPVGIVVHSTGANNTALGRYVQPSESDPNKATILADIGKNKYGNHWNTPTKTKSVHAFIGKNANGVIETYHVLPYNYCAWGVGKGKKGSYNYNPTAHIHFEICEDNLKDATYFSAVFKEAAEYCAYLCKELDIPVEKICSHNEAYKAGYGSGHKDCDHWLKKHGKTMDWFRAEVKALLTGIAPEKIAPYNVKVTASAGLNIRKGAGTNFVKNGLLKKNTVVTIVEEGAGKGADLWGKLADGRGWISLDYTEKVKGFAKYKVKVTASSGVNIRKGAGTNYAKNGALKKNSVVTIVSERTGTGATLWGELEIGAGWIALDYCKKV